MIRLNESNYQNRNLKPFDSENPAFKSSFVDYHNIYGKKPRTYICKACDHESQVLSNFKAHHKTRKHQDYLNAWNHNEDKKKMILQDQPQSKRAKTMILNKQTYIAPTEGIILHDRSTFKRHDNNDCVKRKASQLAQEKEEMAKNEQWKNMEKSMIAKTYQSKAVSDI